MPPAAERLAMTPAPAEYGDRCRAAVEAEGLPFLAQLIPPSQGVPDYVHLVREAVKATAPKTAAAPTATPAIAIPDQLRRDDLRFIKVRAGGKDALEKAWPTVANYAHDSPAIALHTANGGNFGLFPASGSRLLIIDADDLARLAELDALTGFPATFTIASGSSSLEKPKRHFFFEIEGEPLEGKRPFFDPATAGPDGHLGDLFAQGPTGRGYVVGPGSIHPCGEPYTVLSDLPIATLPREAWDRFAAAVRWSTTPPATKPAQPRTAPRGGSLGDLIGLKVTDVWAIPADAERSGDEVRFAHPVHGSTTGKNLGYNRQKDLWHCHRCDSGGDALAALAVDEGIIDCSEARPGVLNDSDLMKRTAAAAAARGFDVEGAERKRRATAPRAKTPATPAPGAPPQTVPDGADDEIAAAARDILETGDPIKYHRDAFATVHSGDQEIGDVWLMAAMTQAAVTTAGIQPGFTGKKGSGKSSGTRAALHLHPPEYVEDGSFSNMAHLYDDTLGPGTVFYSDDTALGLDKISMIKRAMTEYQTGIVHKTVNKVNGRNVAQRLTIPPRCVFGFSSVHTAGDSELRDRQYLISLSPTIKQSKDWLAFFLDRLAEGREEYPITREVLVCREMIRQIKRQSFKVRVPFKDRLVFSDAEAKRDIIMFMDFVQASAILHHLRREHTTGPDGVVDVVATDDDFKTAMAIFKESDAVRKFKISKDERALLQWLAERPGIALEGMTEQEIVSIYGAGRTTVRNLLYGRPPANGDAGICNSVPGVYSQKETREGGRGKAMVNVIYVTGDVVPSVMDFKSFVILKPAQPDTPDTPLTRG